MLFCLDANLQLAVPVPKHTQFRLGDALIINVSAVHNAKVTGQLCLC